MNLRQLELFIAVAEAGSVSRGTDMVSLTQSTASQHIAAMEAEIGAGLFDRTGRGIVLTSAGELFLRHTRRILAERDALLQAMASYQGLEQANLVIGASNIPANYLIPSLLVKLKQEHPGISLAMITGDTRDILQRLENAEFELAVVGSQFENNAIEFLPLLNDPLVLVVGPEHHWQHQCRVSLDELVAEPLLIRESGSGSGQSLEKALSQAGVNPAEVTVAARLGSNEAVLQAVVKGAGCAFVSELSVQRSLDCGELYKVEVEGLSVERRIWIARLHARTASPAAGAFMELLQQNYVEGT